LTLRKEEIDAVARYIDRQEEHHRVEDCRGCSNRSQRTRWKAPEGAIYLAWVIPRPEGRGYANRWAVSPKRRRESSRSFSTSDAGWGSTASSSCGRRRSGTRRRR
jgi:hypothetical protein